MTITLSLIKELKSNLNTSTYDLTSDITDLEFKRQKQKRVTIYPYSDIADIEIMNQLPLEIGMRAYLGSLSEMDNFRKFIGFGKDLNNYYFRYRGDRVLRVSDIEITKENMRSGDENNYFFSTEMICADPFLYSLSNVSGWKSVGNTSAVMNISYAGNKEGYFDRIRVYGCTTNGSHTIFPTMKNINDSNVRTATFCATLLSNAYMEYRHEDRKGYYVYSFDVSSNCSQYQDDIVNESASSCSAGKVTINDKNGFVTFEINVGYPITSAPNFNLSTPVTVYSWTSIRTSTTNSTSNFSTQATGTISEVHTIQLQGLEGYKRYWLQIGSDGISGGPEFTGFYLRGYHDLSYVDVVPLYEGNNSFQINLSADGSSNCSIWYCYRNAYHF